MRFPPLLSNDAGSWCKKEEQLRRIIPQYPPDTSELCGLAIVCGSYTLRARKGYPEPNFLYFEHSETSINRIGLENPGIAEAKDFLPRIWRDFPKTRIVVSLAHAPQEEGFEGYDKKELNERPELQYELMLNEISGVDVVPEFNLSCPTLEGKLIYKDVKTVEKILERCEDAWKGDYVIKLGYMLPHEIHEIAELTGSYKPSAIVLMNTLPGRLVDIRGRPFIAREFKGVGGIGGSFLFPLTIYMIGEMRKRLDELGREDISLVASGGLVRGKHRLDPITGEDIPGGHLLGSYRLLNYLRYGARGARIGTLCGVEEHEPSIIREILHDFCLVLMEEENLEIKDVDEIIGKHLYDVAL